ncbi:MBL fold metallo-hydrolase RNA specificity domain-containing protein [Desulfoplanes formicivorans]|uniref:Metallo-beta-lactamase n=1 Tax=Desulfoplanes formicivorans TaxID=1592317 RepID=A0A194AJX1_9BACT|nr:MBL fold metallo-hydrolase [Desulfoplanes formicivorans]GAU09540.1 metallo-beta-lactamase [Desulfoplanes formicivorans]
MKIKFVGAARTVTGSCYILEAAGHRFAVDCGMHQGNREIEKRNYNQINAYHPDKVEFILLTHAHIDHSGLLPRFVRNGFSGPIYTTTPTRDLLEIMLKDSAHIQEMEARWENKRRQRHGREPIDPLYDQEDAQKTIPLIEPVDYDTVFEPAPGIRVKFKDAGHILGSGFIELWVEENGRVQKMVFSGDLGRPNQLIIRDPEVVNDADFLFMESTYGNRNHKDESRSREELAEAIRYSYGHGQKVIIPAFAVERSQELIYSLHLLAKEGKLPEDMPVYLDSPLAIRATKIFRKYREFYDAESQEILSNGEDPLSLPNLRLTLSAEESMEINRLDGPAVVISASGMANAGRIKHHLRHNLWKQGASVVFVGFQAFGTPGRKIVDGAKEIRILGEQIAVNARVFTIGGFSAHAGQEQLLTWLSHFYNPNLRVFLIHGEYEGQKVLASLIRERFGFEVHIPEYLEECDLVPGEAVTPRLEPEKAHPGIDWDYLVEDTRNRVKQLVEKKERLTAMNWVHQTEIRDNLVDINGRLSQLLSEIYPDAGQQTSDH